MQATTNKTVSYTRQDFISNQEVRWCPGCGDYSILMALQKAMSVMGRSKEDFVVISGIGCAGRLPYYMDTYGFHTIHGRAPSIATGVKVMSPELSVWVITGDGDALSIGGNHIIHTLRRNININIALFNNAIYGLTKGQSSPTSEQGTITNASPFGSIDSSLDPLVLALSIGATFIARSADVLLKDLQDIFIKGDAHKGTTFIEILQNCHIFNDGAFKKNLEKSLRSDKILFLEDKKPMIFGEKQDKALIFNYKKMQIESALISNIDSDQILVHDVSDLNMSFHLQLIQLRDPMVMGVIKKINKPTYEDLMLEQEESVTKIKGKGDLKKLLHQAKTWVVS